MTSKLPKLLKTMALVICDALLIILAGGLAFYFRFEFDLAEALANAAGWIHFLPIQIAIMVCVLAWFHLYSLVLHAVTVQDIPRIIVAVFFGFIVSVAFSYLLTIGTPVPRSVRAFELILDLVFLTAIRCAVRFLNALKVWLLRKQVGEDERIMIIGAGSAGAILVKEIHSNVMMNGQAVCIIDDDPELKGKYLEGVPVVGGRKKILQAAEDYHITQIVFAIPTIASEEKAKILNICKETGCRVRTLPGIYQMVEEPSLAAVRDIQVEDLLGRDPVKLDDTRVNEFLFNRVVLVTGGGGSIGSELCRQIAKRRPKRLVIIDIYENNAYDIQQELIRTYGNQLDLKVEIASVRDKERIYEIVEYHRPDIIFHAAAHKHVPLMENSPEEAIKNNVFGTYHVVRAAEKFGVQKFIMISTDKAVNPTNVMGATKRFCEMILQSRRYSQTEYACVRFGNVLGSNGSVVPLFKRQIENGGPVTITDKRIIRYFMTIPEAAQLVLEAGAMAKQSQIFVLDMGNPVRILDLAENLIRLSGLEPYKDIEIKEIGLRPGEKLYEELLMKSEHLIKTTNSKIFIEEQQEISPEVIMAELENFDRALQNQYTNEQLVELLHEFIPTYHTPEEVNSKASV